MSDPIARSPITPIAPVEVRDGWEVSVRHSRAALVLCDETPLAKVLVRAPEAGPTADALAVPRGAARGSGHGLVVGAGPGEWLVLGDVGAADAVAAWVTSVADPTEHVSVLDQTHGRALVRLTGRDAAGLLGKLCAIDLSDAATPDGAALRTSVANVVTDLVRDDRDATPSYLLHCERSSGQYLFDALLDAGDEFGVEVTGFTP